ncbi:RNA-directed DNA polymerase from mobile element jockey [Trichonephila clavipes]|nr:RNA-directed DNA polymerase from mobile element jockey [Trichonephila clavipes]
MLAKPNQDRTYPQGYRPISLINATAKIFERIILTRIKAHCKAIDCIPPEQCGFREGHSTLHQLICVTNIINEGYAHKFYTVGVFLDVERAFDKMWHDGLTYKLIKLLFPDYLIKIIHNFLHNRTFRVRVNNSYSNTGSCLSGVPQGSVLSPYLYNIYTHDFPQHSTVSTCLFADDSAVLSQSVQLKYTIKTVQHFLDKLETWLTHWRIAINVDKSQAIVFKKWGVIDPPFQLTLFDDNIQWVPAVKYLGLHIDSRLTFKKHIDYLSQKFWGRISLAISLVGRRSPLSLENKVILYKQILRPVITYGSPVWGAAAATHMKKIQGSSESVQEFAARIKKLGTQIFQSGNSAQNTAVRNANDQLLQSRFINSLRNDIRRFVFARDPINLEESINAALIEEQNVKLNQIANDERFGLSPSQTETSVISALTNKLQEINLSVERLQEAS